MAFVLVSLYFVARKRRTPTNAQRLTPPQFLIDYHNKTLWFLLCYIPASTRKLWPDFVRTVQ